MQLTGKQFRLSATDLANHLGCVHLTGLSRAVAEGRAQKPYWNDPLAQLLKERGIQHEKAYLQRLRAAGDRSIVEIPVDPGRDRTADTVRAMHEGADVIYQAPLGDERWYGRADFLKRVPKTSALGAWSYEVVDAKLATETRAGTLLQLCLYSELVGAIQGLRPEYAHVVAPHHHFDPEPYRLTDYAAYYRLVKRRLEAAIDSRAAETYPEPVQQCEICAWWGSCDSRRRADDHLSFVAGISRLQIKELRGVQVNSLERLGVLEVVPRPARGSRDALTRTRDQAAIQLRGRRAGRPLHEILQPVGPAHGFASLPAPSTHDVFLDLEGDRLALDGGREYLFGYVTSANDRYVGLWAATPAEEKAAFEAIVDYVLAAFAEHPDMHVYHFGAYEPAAFKRLASRYATREAALDKILRAELFVDLHTIVRHSLRASVESYSIKELEQFYGLAREQDLRAATLSRRAIEWAIEMHDDLRAPELAPHITAVERYNREDCVSAAKLYEWLETLRADAIVGAPLARPELKSGAASEKIEETAEETQAVIGRLLDGVPAEERDEEQQARWLTAHLLEWHRREFRAAAWEFFRLRDLPLEDYADERSALADLVLVSVVGGTANKPVERYSFPGQENDIRERDDACLPGGDRIGSIVAVDVDARTIDIERTAKTASVKPTHIFVRRGVRKGNQAQALLDLGRWIAERGVDAPGEHRAARDLILRRAPRLVAKSAGLTLDTPDLLDLAQGMDAEVVTACRLARELDRGVLPIQGPPGTGKTYTGSHMIVKLLEAGKKVGVTAVGHKVIRNLLGECGKTAQKLGIAGIRCIHRDTKDHEDSPFIDTVEDYDDIRAWLRHGERQLLGGTAWLWSKAEFRDSVDVLFIDEAGQMSLADVLAVAGGARNLVLLGDPQQLEQPQQASHPPGTGASALEHILGGRKTIPEDCGMFLKETRRLHPAICAFTAELFYEDRLRAFPGLDRQSVGGPTSFAGSGLVYVPVEHHGNQSRATEEIAVIKKIVADLTSGDVMWRDKHGAERALGSEDLLIVAPYNAQVTALAGEIPGVRVGTVDKFQGQEAPVVIVSLTTSAPDDAPRGMTFLYSANRLNVATSRAKGLSILVGSPRLFEPDCKTPEQMRLANAFCRYLELARVVRV